MNLRPIQLEVRRSIVTDFKRLAKEVFPREAFAYLLGRDAGDLVEIEDIWVPMDLEDWITNESVNISDQWLPAARKHAKELGLTVVGDLHSHPFTVAELGHRCLADISRPSATDMENGLQWINGVCGVLMGTTGKLRSSVRFWGPMFPVRTWVKK